MQMDNKKWKQNKKCYKLCRNNESATKRGEKPIERAR